jgi:hypothetical protein
MDLDDAQMYRYKQECPIPPTLPTGPKHLRFLRLLRGSGDSRIECELTISKAEDEKYEAVSWCWGREARTKIIKILDIERNPTLKFLVSPNLEAALKCLRKDAVPRVLWIDAICINQDDFEERSEQVPLMAQIYGQATNVCVWLGAGDSSSNRAITFIKERVLRPESFDKLVQDNSTASEWMAVNTLMMKPWFSRRWVVQEVALALKATLHCGTDEIGWQEFATAVSLFSHVEIQNQAVSKIIKTDSEYDNIPGFFGNISELSATRLVDATSNLIRRSKVNGPDKAQELEPLQNLEYLVSTLSNFSATEPRDTIYALLAIARDTFPGTAKGEPAHSFSFSPATFNQLVEWGSKNIGSQVYLVDYKKPFFEVCKDFVIFAIRKSEGTTALDIICRPWAPDVDSPPNRVTAEIESTTTQNQARKEKKLPTWIPRLSESTRIFAKTEASAHAGTSMDRLNADPLVGLPTELKPYRAAGSRSVTKLLKFESGGDEYDDYESMFVEGFVLDKVNQLEERSQGGMIPSEWLTLGDWNDTASPPPEEFWRTLVADRGPNGRNVLTFYTTACSHALRRGVKGGTINTDKIISYGGCSVVTDFVRRVQAVIWNRRLIRTHRGHYLGLVPKATREEDLVCILYGCTVPVILRRHEKTPEQMEQQRVARRNEDMSRAAAKILSSWRRKKVLRAQEERKEMEREREKATKNTANSSSSRTTPRGKRRRQTDLDEALAAADAGSPSKRMKHRQLCGECHRPFEKSVTRKPTLQPNEPYKVLEPDPVYYEFIGECYVHGMMNGEAITVKGKSTAEDAESEDSMKTINFELR